MFARPALFTNALVAAEEFEGIFAAASEEDAASVEGARAGGVATLGTGFAAGALCANRDFVEVNEVSSFGQLRFLQ